MVKITTKKNDRKVMVSEMPERSIGIDRDGDLWIRGDDNAYCLCKNGEVLDQNRETYNLVEVALLRNGEAVTITKY